MGRPATGNARWDATASCWVARVTLPNGKRKPVPMRDRDGKRLVPPCLVSPATPSPGCVCASCEHARRFAKLTSDRVRAEGSVPASTSETCDEWYERYHSYQVELGRSDAKTKRTRWRKWISGRLGTLTPANVTRAHVEDLRDELDASIRAWEREGRAEDRVSGKTAMNVWSALTSSFKAMMSSKRRDLRVLEARTNPCTGVEPPGDRDSRKARRKPFLYPREAMALLACEAIPLEWREVHAIAAYLYLRPGELRVLTWADVDLNARIVSVAKAWDYEAEKVKPPKTRNGVRRVPIESEIAPLLTRLREGKAATDLVVPLIASVPDNSLGATFRNHLVMAHIERPELHNATRTHAHSNFRTWRDSGLTWLALSGLGVDKIMRRAGHDTVQTTMGYVKQAEDLTGDLGIPFGSVPQSLIAPVSSVPVSAFRIDASNDSASFWRRARDSNPGDDTSRSVDATQEIPAPRGSPATKEATVSDGNEQPKPEPGDALEASLLLAAQAGRFDVVTQLARELEARRSQRGPNVVRIDATMRRSR